MTANYEHLREVAEKATPGPWYHVQAFQRVPNVRTIHGSVDGHRVDFVSTSKEPVHTTIIASMEGRESAMRSCDMAFIATFNPATAIALIDELAVLRKENEGLRAKVDGFNAVLKRYQDARVFTNLHTRQVARSIAEDAELDTARLLDDAARAAIGDSHE